MWLNDIADPLHFGTWGGTTTKILWFIFGLSVSGLIVLGLYLSIPRNKQNSLSRLNKGLTSKALIGLAILSIFYFMLERLQTRYQASELAYFAIAVFWLLLLSSLYFLLVYKRKQPTEQ